MVQGSQLFYGLLSSIFLGNNKYFDSKENEVLGNVVFQVYKVDW